MAKGKFKTLADREVDTILKRIGKKSKFLRREAKISLEALAYESEVSRSTLVRLEAGGDTTLRSLLKTLYTLDITPEDFFKSIK